MANNDEPRIFTQLSDELKRVFGEQIARLERELKPGPSHSPGPRKPDLAEQEAQLGMPEDEADGA